MKRILFVDDDPAVLDGLRDRLRKQRREWHMAFAQGGEAALAECARGAFDVVVSDMRMPGMDGATLLRRIKEAYPDSVRIILSGHAEREAVLRALPVAHQYLSKPCDAETLRSVIARACALQDLLSDTSLRRLVGGIARLPSVSKIYVDLTELLAGSPSIAEVAAVVESDPAMCLKILQVVNSAFFGLPRRVSAMREAISYLGIEVLKSLVLASQIFASNEGQEGLDGVTLASAQQHALLVARVARAIFPASADDAFMAGMLHDIGHVVLALADRGRWESITRAARERSVPSYVVERERLAVTHAELGAYILGSWGMPFTIVEAVASHHEPRRLGSYPFGVVTALHVAESLVRASVDRRSPQETGLDYGYLAELGLLEELAGWQDVVEQARSGQ